MSGLIEFFSKMGPARIAAMGAVTLALIGFFGMIALRVSQPTLGVLYSDLAPEDAAAILKDLETRAAPFELRDDGRTIAVRKTDIPRLRMELASKGMPAGGSVGYEIFDRPDSFSATSFVQGVNAVRALEGELARTIRSVSRVQSARVHLVIPERRIFERDREQPRASIALKLAGELDAGQVRAIRHLVASAVNGLKPDKISIVDEKGRLLADGAQGEAGTGIAMDDKQLAYERRLKAQIEELVGNVAGLGRSRVQVAAELDTNRVQQTSETFDPESRVVRSTQTRNENQSTLDASGQVTVGNELPSAQGANQNAQAKDASSKNEELVNYEISKTTRTEVIEGGRVKRVSVAVLVDGVYTRNAAGDVTYQPRTQEELDRIAMLVRSSMGFDAKRGDQLEVVNLRFAEAPAQADAPLASGMLTAFVPTRDDIMRGLELFVLAVLTLVVLLVVVRPMVRTIMAPVTPKLAFNGAMDAGQISPPPAAPALPETEAGRMLEIARVNGAVQAKSIEKIGDMVRENPTATATIVRQWIHEGT